MYVTSAECMLIRALNNVYNSESNNNNSSKSYIWPTYLVQNLVMTKKNLKQNH